MADKEEAQEAVVIGPEQAVVLRILTPSIKLAMERCESGEYGFAEAWRRLIVAAQSEPRPASPPPVARAGAPRDDLVELCRALVNANGEEAEGAAIGAIYSYIDDLDAAPEAPLPGQSATRGLIAALENIVNEAGELACCEEVWEGDRRAYKSLCNIAANALKKYDAALTTPSPAGQGEAIDRRIVVDAIRRHGDTREPWAVMSLTIADAVVATLRASAQPTPPGWDMEPIGLSLVVIGEGPFGRDVAICHSNEQLREAVMMLGADDRKITFKRYVEKETTRQSPLVRPQYVKRDWNP